MILLMWSSHKRKAQRKQGGGRHEQEAGRWGVTACPALSFSSADALMAATPSVSLKPLNSTVRNTALGIM